MKTLRRNRPGFTLIELLIVIAIILILIAIALPNFLEAQIRAKVTKAKGRFGPWPPPMRPTGPTSGITQGRASPTTQWGARTTGGLWAA